MKGKFYLITCISRAEEFFPFLNECKYLVDFHCNLVGCSWYTTFTENNGERTKTTLRKKNAVSLFYAIKDQSILQGCPYIIELRGEFDSANTVNRSQQYGTCVTLKCLKLPLFFWFFIIVSFRTWQKVCRSGFLRTIIQLACIFWNDVIKALTSDVTLTSLGTLKRECRL